MTYQVTIPADAIKAAALFTSKERGRYAFGGVLVESGRLVATDGRALVRVTWTPYKDDVPPDAHTILDPKALLTAAKVKGTQTVTANGALVVRAGEAELARLPVETIDGTFPDHEAVFPKAREAVESMELSPVLVEQVCKAAQIVRPKAPAPRVSWTFHGTNAAARFQVDGHNCNLDGLVMPVAVSK